MWKALDKFVFILTQVAVVGWDRRMISDEKVYRALTYLSNAVYYLHYGKQSPDIVEKARKNIRRFCRAIQSIPGFGKNMCTHKFHVLQHLPDLVEQHGAAFMWDAFNYESLLGTLLKSVTSTVNQGDQLVTNFLLLHHAAVFHKFAEFSNDVQEILTNELGVKLSQFAISLGTCVLQGDKRPLQEKHADHFRNFAGVDSNVQIERISRLKFRCQILTSRHFRHRQKVNDSYVCVDERHFGQIHEMCEMTIEDERRFFIMVQVYKKSLVLASTGQRFAFPDNQFPVEPTQETVVYELNDDIFVQKIHYISPVIMWGAYHDFFALRPNDFFCS